MRWFPQPRQRASTSRAGPYYNIQNIIYSLSWTCFWHPATLDIAQFPMRRRAANRLKFIDFRMLERPPPPDKARRRRGIRSRSAARSRRGDWFWRREITAIIRARPTDDRGDRGAAGRARGLADRRRRGGWTSHRRLSRSGPTGPFCRPRSSAVEAVPRAAACGNPYCAGAHA
jgi:hypothetical protein